jgi:hypothetical protein
MSTPFKAAVDSYLRAKTLSRGAHNVYHSTVRKWEQWGGGPPIEALQHKVLSSRVPSPNSSRSSSRGARAGYRPRIHSGQWTGQ